MLTFSVDLNTVGKSIMKLLSKKHESNFLKPVLSSKNLLFEWKVRFIYPCIFSLFLL